MRFLNFSLPPPLRYNSLSEGHRQAFGADEDYLLSLILHNLLVYMLALGKTAAETTDIIHRLTARTRLATLEEKQLQKTLRIVEQNVSLSSYIISPSAGFSVRINEARAVK